MKKERVSNPDEGKFFLFCSRHRQWVEVQRKQAKFLGVWVCPKCKPEDNDDKQ